MVLLCLFLEWSVESQEYLVVLLVLQHNIRYLERGKEDNFRKDLEEFKSPGDVALSLVPLGPRC